MSSPAPPLREIGFVLFPNLTLLDLIGPHAVLTRLPDARVHLLWHRDEPIQGDAGARILPTATFAACPPLDLVCVPGGPGHLAAMEDEPLLAFLRAQAAGARLTTSVCTGSLVLAAAGLLRGYRATSHWASVERLAAFGATPVHERAVFDRDRVTAGGVTSGIDFALSLVAALYGPERAQLIQLSIEYDPAPPFEAGSPRTAPAEILERSRSTLQPYLARMDAVDRRVMARLDGL